MTSIWDIPTYSLQSSLSACISLLHLYKSPSTLELLCLFSSADLLSSVVSFWNGVDILTNEGGAALPVIIILIHLTIWRESTTSLISSIPKSRIRFLIEYNNRIKELALFFSNIQLLSASPTSNLVTWQSKNSDLPVLHGQLSVESLFAKPL